MATLSNICIKLIGDRLADLEQPQALEDEEVVHQLRVLTKQLRSAWHLVQPVCGKALAKQRRDALQGISALLADSRDQSVQQTLKEKFHLDHPEVSKESLDALFVSLPPDSSQSKSASIADIRQALEAESATWSKIRLGNDERSTLRHRWRRSLKKAKTLTLETINSNDPELWHSWRKAIKRLRYQREFLAEVNPRILGKKDIRIRRLGTRLGDLNDLAVFSQKLDSATLNQDELNQLKKIVAIKGQDIKRNCRRLGRKIFGK